MAPSVVPVATPTLNAPGDSPALTPPKPRLNARKCRACGEAKLLRYLDLGKLAASTGTKYSVQMFACAKCKLSQLGETMPYEGKELDRANDIHAALDALDIFQGVVVLPYIGAILDNIAFDMIHPECANYWSVTALRDVCKQHGLHVYDVQPAPGCCIRVSIRRAGTPADTDYRVTKYIVDEMHDLRRATYEAFSARVTRRVAEINETLLTITPYVGFGVSTMLQCLDVRAYPYEVYDNDGYAYAAVPGTRVPVRETAGVHPAQLPGPLVIFDWPYADTIIANLRKAGYTGHIYVPLPKPYWDSVDDAAQTR